MTDVAANKNIEQLNLSFNNINSNVLKEILNVIKLDGCNIRKVKLIGVNIKKSNQLKAYELFAKYNT